MPDHAWKFSLVLVTLAASMLICHVRRIQIRARSGGRHHAGLRAGRHRMRQPTVPGQPTANQTDDQADGQASRRRSKPEFTMDRFDRGTEGARRSDRHPEVTIRAYGQAVEIIIPKQARTNWISSSGGSPTWASWSSASRPIQDTRKTEPIIEQAKLAPPARRTSIWAASTSPNG